MSVRAIQNDTNENSGKLSYIGSAIVGAVGGYSLKWGLPVTAQEKDERYRDELSKVRIGVKNARMDEVGLIRKEASKIVGADEFLHLYDNNKLIHTEIKKYQGSLSEKLTSLLARVNNSAIIARDIGIRKIISYTKSIRPTGAFIAIGTGVALITALVHNMYKEVSKESGNVD